MKRAHGLNLTLAWLGVYLASGSGAAAAQTSATALNVTLLKIGDSTYNARAMRPISKAECDEPGLALTFRVDGLGVVSNPSFLEVWVGTACDSTDRKDTTKGDPCTVLADEKLADTDKTKSAFKVPVDVLCEEEGTRKLFFLGVDTLNSTVAPTYVGTLDVEIDTVAPAAPRNVRGGSGETEIPVSWDSDDDDVEGYLLVWDENTSNRPSSKDAGASDDDGGTLLPGPSDCSSSQLVGGDDLGGDLDELPNGLGGEEIDGKVESTEIDGTRFDRERIAVGVIAVDLAGNASPVSNIACIRVVPTTGFWDQYQGTAGAVDEGCTCSLPGSKRAHGGAWPVGLALGALLLRVRRRRS